VLKCFAMDSKIKHVSTHLVPRFNQAGPNFSVHNSIKLGVFE